MKGYVVCVYKNITNEGKLKEYAIKARTAVENIKVNSLLEVEKPLLMKVRVRLEL